MGLVVGLTGGIGSGKSAAAEIFASLGIPVVDADAIAHELTGPGGAAMPALTAAFGESIRAADASLDRAAMRALAFGNPDIRKRLEGILHPLIRDESDRRCRQACEAGAPYVIMAVPLLVESGDFRRRVDRVLVIDSEDEIRIARVMARSGLERAQVERIMAAQCSRNERLTAADDIIDNSGSLDKLAAQANRLHQQYLGLAAAKRSAGEKKVE